MRFFSVRLLLSVITVGCYQFSFAQVRTNTELLRQSSVLQAAKEKRNHEQLMSLARQKGWDTVITRPNGYVSILAGIDAFGLPLYLSTENNILAAATIGTSKLWPGGSTGLNLSGSSANMKDKLAMWDGGRVRATHTELTGRIKQTDGTENSDHATHVAGTMIASGVNPLAKGMSFGLQELVAYDFSGDNSEMMGAASNLLISNHSYGFNAGWVYNSDVNPARWEYWGPVGSVEDYKFGYYSSGAQLWDSIAYNAPYYLIVKSAGNSRNTNGPDVGQPYWRYNAAGQMASAGNRPAGISDNDSYDILSTNSNAKNILVVGAVNPISSGYSRPQDVVMSDFSSWGPTDDGRIKPDVVADGVNVLSSVATSNTAYATFSGTSMSSPNAAGSLLLLQEYYSQLHSGAFMRSATLKGLVIHTADEAGASPGPDYQFGWGLINMQKAAAVITSNNTKDLIQENVLNNGASYSLPVIASGDGVIRATISWTDPKAETVEPEATALNNPAKKLVNDLDIVIKKGATTYRPWILTPATPSAAATRGDNTRDNVEKIELTDVVPGDSYTIEVTHKNTLQRGSQAYSLIVSGVGGLAYCASAASNTGGARIDSVSFSNIRQKNPAGCTSYTSYTNLTGNIEPGQTLPIFVRLNSCDASVADKIVKVFIDANNDGDFTDAGETLATSGVINGNGDFTGNVTIPASLTAGKYTILRIVMQETNNAANVTSCGSYTKGETQDYRLLAVTPSLDFGITELLSPEAGNCPSPAQYVSVRVRNFGNANKKNIPLTAVVKQGATTIATLTATYADTISAQTDEVYTFQTPVEIAPGQSYTITATTAFPGDQNATNDQSVFSFTSRAAASNPTGTAVICGPTARLNATAVSGAQPYNWYSSATATTPLATGSTASSSTILSTYYLSSGETAKLGPANKQVFTDGGYNAFSGNIVKFTASIPVTLQTARLYIGNSGKITFTLRQIVSENANGTYTFYPISSKTIDVYATAPTPPELGAQNNDPADAGAIYYLGIDFPEAANYYLLIECSNGASIFRNNNIASTIYPYSVPGVLSITGNSATLTGDPNYYQKFYYFYYDIGLKLTNCSSGRVPIVATTNPTPTVTLNGNVLTSSIATGNQWYLNDVLIDGATGQTYTATATGVYTTKVTTGSCTITSNAINFTATPVTNVDPEEIGMKVSPNPSPGGQFTLQLVTRTRSNLDISLVSTTGQQVYRSQIPDFTGTLSKLITPGKLAAGVYYLQVTHDKKLYIKKIIVLE